MDLKSPKDLEKLANACRKAGIQSFKGFGVEFTLDAFSVPKVDNRRSKQTVAANEAPQGHRTVVVPGPNGPVELKLKADKDEIATDTPTRDELMFWSVADEETA